jgi:uncharacterized repeat protein (TIGR03803 family)
MAGLAFVDGHLYGTTEAGGDDGEGDSVGLGTVFEVNARSAAERVIHNFTHTAGDGTQPLGDLTLHDGELYGSTSLGGLCGCGIVYRIDVLTHDFKFLSGVDDPTLGFYISGTLAILGGDVFGTTQFGGTFDGKCLVNGGRHGVRHGVQGRASKMKASAALGPQRGR